ncbi:glycerophosphodiester phosphodiesterase family protein [Hyphobacterium marinum]|uniref:Glycerophosphodiester phosphodiesterase family protein n=1 Tax=Hyphobacterium marinum TaxID=3116574 RepID=A0ABU7LUZ8_9PROT|nr:glycerophosphodiester phosphodiesterase family protein [Hyphobacterium sp. Y6023]MEE2565370.1 glycerophosphodiester phosphodiesterase family protein [Hyphobacterium sp. Y6023]
MKPVSALGALLLLSCAPGAVPDSAPAPLLPVEALLDCAREADATLLSAHRGGAGPGIPDNSLAALRQSAALGAAFAEIDLRRTADGEIVLMHDDTLDRTTTGRGRLDRYALAELRDLRLRDPRGRETGETVPTLAEAFAVANETGLLLQLDPKTVSPLAAARAASDAGMGGQVVVITNSEADAAAVLAVDPDIAVSYAIRSERHLLNTELDLSRVVSWMGRGVPEARIEAALTGMGVETAAHDFSAEAEGRADYALFDRLHVEVLAVDDVAAAVRAVGGAGDHCPTGPAD